MKTNDEVKLRRHGGRKLTMIGRRDGDGASGKILEGDANPASLDRLARRGVADPPPSDRPRFGPNCRPETNCGSRSFSPRNTRKTTGEIKGRLPAWDMFIMFWVL
jgi:hypothetical protein